MSNIKGHVAELLKIISEGLWEKEHIISLGLLSCIAGESIFLLGPPGTAKSMVARRLKEVFKNKRSFEYLMSRWR
jgi:MoxR-like ATPase